MGEFRIGRVFARHTYPEAPRGVGAGTTFARNFASGPKSDTAIGTGLQIPWNVVDAGTPPTTADVPITAISTGIMIVTGVATIHNPTGAAILATLTVQVDGSATSSFSAATVPAGGDAAITVLAETDPGTTPIGVTHQIEISVDGNGARIRGDSATISVQEVSIATG